MISWTNRRLAGLKFKASEAYNDCDVCGGCMSVGGGGEGGREREVAVTPATDVYRVSELRAGLQASWNIHNFIQVPKQFNVYSRYVNQPFLPPSRRHRIFYYVICIIVNRAVVNSCR